MNKVVLAAIGMTAMAASAANLTWVGGPEGDWNTATNWDPQQVPTNKDTVFFDSAQSITVNLGTTQIFATLSVSNTPCLKFVGVACGSEIQVQQDSKHCMLLLSLTRILMSNSLPGRSGRTIRRLTSSVASAPTIQLPRSVEAGPIKFAAPSTSRLALRSPRRWTGIRLQLLQIPSSMLRQKTGASLEHPVQLAITFAFPAMEAEVFLVAHRSSSKQPMEASRLQPSKSM